MGKDQQHYHSGKLWRGVKLLVLFGAIVAAGSFVLLTGVGSGDLVKTLVDQKVSIKGDQRKETGGERKPGGDDGRREVASDRGVKDDGRRSLSQDNKLDGHGEGKEGIVLQGNKRSGTGSAQRNDDRDGADEKKEVDGAAVDEHIVKLESSDTHSGKNLNEEPVMIGAEQRELGANSTAFPTRKFTEDGHLCNGMWFEDCFWNVSQIISSRFQHATRTSSFHVEDDSAVTVRATEHGPNRKLEDWATGPTPRKLGEGKLRLQIIKGLYHREKPVNDPEFIPITSMVDVSSYRFGSLALQPRVCTEDFEQHQSDETGYKFANLTKVPWLAQFTNVYVSGVGVVLVPIRRKLFARKTWYAHAYELGGGCCTAHWKPLLGRTITVDTSGRMEPVLFSAGQHHGLTYHHVVVDLLPRILSFWSLLSGLRRGRILLSGDARNKRNAVVAENLLEALGWPKQRTVTLDQYEFRPVERLYVPAPVSQDRSFYSRCFGRCSAQVLRALVHDLPEDRGKQAARILLIDRASRRRNGRKPRCRGLRCIGNLLHIKEALEAEFGDKIVVKIIGKTRGNTVIRTIREFKKARIVIGGHGAGFQNLMFMEKGSYAIHIGWQRMWKLYADQAERYGVHFKNVLTRGAGQGASNIKADVRVIVNIVRDILSRTK